MAMVDILLEGYVADDSSDGRYRPTITLVRTGPVRMVVDPGTVADQSIIVEALVKRGLTTGDIDVVFITHSHLDHYRNLGMFPQARAVEYWGVWDGDRCTEWREEFAEDVRILRTPGHSRDSLSLLVRTSEGLVAICGDVFWKRDSPDEDPYAEDPVQLEQSRSRILDCADYVIPGHGDRWEVPK